jgi:acyl-CoA thioester hydrolase
MIEVTDAEDGGWLLTHRAAVNPWQCDVNDHLTAREYLGFAGDAEWRLLFALGDGRDQAGLSWADVKHEIVYKQELRAGDLIDIVSRVTSVGRTSIGTEQRIVNARTGEHCATVTSVTVQFDLVHRRAMPLRNDIRAAAERMCDLAKDTNQPGGQADA